MWFVTQECVWDEELVVADEVNNSATPEANDPHSLARVDIGDRGNPHPSHNDVVEDTKWQQ